MSAEDLSSHAPFAFTAAGLTLLSLADPAWWPTEVGWAMLALTLMAWLLFAARARRR
ncbi:hypothetical protein [Saccharothrix australiensis]|uniref:Uncharacterized protein n=1 Tax=Saccharothrix australiensis TaxID=2072 RepID=A0A495VYE4_9PSEU|nr:hypothetical protein [Saccharothrix australiensis]RKT54451.1 hypothetical protein C8E97_3073 [Saccharothrix australiensis]